MRLEFKKAERRKAKLRMFMFGISGSGKTHQALIIASQLGKRIAVADTEGGHSEFFAGDENIPDFDILKLPDNRIETFLACIQNAVNAKYDVLIIDSATHEWDYIKELAEKGATVTKTGKKDNRSGWGVATPVHKKFLDALMKAPMHIIATVRAKPEWDEETYYDHNGANKKCTIRLRGAPEQKGGLEADFIMTVILDVEEKNEVLGRKENKYYATIMRDRTKHFVQGTRIENPGIDFACEIVKAISIGKDIESTTSKVPSEQVQQSLASPEQLKRLDHLWQELKTTPESIKKGLEMNSVSSVNSLPSDVAARWIGSMEEKLKMLNSTHKENSL